MRDMFRALITRWFGSPEIVKDKTSPESAHEHEAYQSSSSREQLIHHTTVELVPYDENLLERSRTQWQFGDWDSLARIERETLQHHPDRAKLALLSAAGHLQKGQNDTARQLIRLAQDWGCSKTLVCQIIIAGVHNSLGCAAAMAGQGARAKQHFESALRTGMPSGDVALLTQARIQKQLGSLGIGPPPALSALMDEPARKF